MSTSTTSMTTPVAVKIERVFEIPNGDIECIIDMAGYAIGYWATQGVHDSDALTYTVTPDPGYATTEGEQYVLTYAEIAKTLLDIATGEYEVGYPREYAEQYLATLFEGDPDAGYFDSEIADVVIQVACYKEVIFG